MTSYSHTQRGRIHLLLHCLAVLYLAIALMVPQILPLQVIFWSCSAVCALLGFCFESLTVTDCGDKLLVAFGRLPVFHTSITYSEVTAVTVTQTRFLDGLGIHWMPGRGWTYNIRFGTCIEVQRGNRRIRVGSDDAENLAELIRERMT